MLDHSAFGFDNRADLNSGASDLLFVAFKKKKQYETRERPNLLTLAISAASNIWCTRESSCSVGRLEGWTSSQTGFEGGQFEIQILIGPDPTENPPQWFLFHYRHTDPHFWRGGRGSGGEEGSVFLWHVYASVVEGAPNKKIFTLPAHFFCVLSVAIVISLLNKDNWAGF